MQVSDDPRVGTELAGYRIESLLGWGGMSVVYVAEDLRLKRRVALKLLAASAASRSTSAPSWCAITEDPKRRPGHTDQPGTGRPLRRTHLQGGEGVDAHLRRRSR